MGLCHPVQSGQIRAEAFTEFSCHKELLQSFFDTEVVVVRIDILLFRLPYLYRSFSAKEPCK